MNKNNKRKCCRNKRNIPAAGLNENNIDFDYDKFAEAIIKAENKITEEKIRKQKEEDEEFQRKWEKALWFNKIKTKCPIINFIYNNFLLYLIVCLGIIFFKKKNILKENATYILFKILNIFLLWTYQIILGLASIISLYYLLTIHSNYFWNIASILVIFFSIIIIRLIRITKLEMENCTDKEAIMSVFNAVIAFTAMILTVITVILTAITLYITINQSSGLIPL